ncbi:MAG: FAD:protein FMN transferase, partial [Pseudomonadota bacterium]
MRWCQFYVTRTWLACCAGLAVLSLGACADDTSWADQYVTLRGETMGTYYALRFKQAAPCQMSVAEADAILAGVNQSMSTYLDASELSKFNADDSLQWRDVSAGLAEVLGVADAVHRASGGAFDVTVGPLVNAWGFGPGRQTAAPSAEAQEAAAASVGMQHLEWEQQNGVTRLRKRVAGVYVDFSALAKGYAVDQLADVLRGRGCAHFMVDVGGEISVSGLNPRAVSWQIGIESPAVGQIGVVQKVMVLNDVSVATSGDYRNFRMVNGRRVDHVFDPRSAGPADNLVVS